MKYRKYLIAIGLVGVIVFYLKITYFNVSVGDKAPDFNTELIDGTPFTLSELKGKYVILDFWGSWCAPCIKESPKLVNLHKKFKDEIAVVTIALEKNPKSWKKVADKAGFDWKYQIVDQNKFVLMSSIARKYGVTEIPAKFLIDPNGKLLGKYSFKEMDSIFSMQKLSKNK